MQKNPNRPEYALSMHMNTPNKIQSLQQRSSSVLFSARSSYIVYFHTPFGAGAEINLDIVNHHRTNHALQKVMQKYHLQIHTIDANVHHMQ